MADQMSVDEIANAMFDIVTATYGKKNLKPMDLQKEIKRKFGADRCDRKNLKLAIRQLIDSGRCIYSYVGGSYVTLPPKE